MKINIKKIFIFLFLAMIFFLNCNKSEEERSKKGEKNYDSIIIKKFQLSKICETQKDFNYFKYINSLTNKKFSYSKIGKRYVLMILLSKLNCNSCLVKFRYNLSNLDLKDIFVVKLKDYNNGNFIIIGKKYPLFLSKNNGLLKRVNISTGPVFIFYDKLDNSVVDIVIKENNKYFDLDFNLFFKKIKRKINRYE